MKFTIPTTSQSNEGLTDSLSYTFASNKTITESLKQLGNKFTSCDQESFSRIVVSNKIYTYDQTVCLFKFISAIAPDVKRLASPLKATIGADDRYYNGHGDSTTDPEDEMNRAWKNLADAMLKADKAIRSKVNIDKFSNVMSTRNRFGDVSAAGYTLANVKQVYRQYMSLAKTKEDIDTVMSGLSDNVGCGLEGGNFEGLLEAHSVDSYWNNVTKFLYFLWRKL